MNVALIKKIDQINNVCFLGNPASNTKSADETLGACCTEMVKKKLTPLRSFINVEHCILKLFKEFSCCICQTRLICNSSNGRKIT